MVAAEEDAPAAEAVMVAAEADAPAAEAVMVAAEDVAAEVTRRRQLGQLGQ